MNQEYREKNLATVTAKELLSRRQAVKENDNFDFETVQNGWSFLKYQLDGDENLTLLPQKSEKECEN